MSAEPNQLVEARWTKWQGQLINGTYLLGRQLGGSDHSAVFHADVAVKGSPQVAVKLVPAARAEAQALLALSAKLSALSHPHLLGLIECGNCQLDGVSYLYVVMEYAEQSLAQLLQQRSLRDDEARGMLLPILDALAVLHSQSLVQGQLKPANILVVGDQIKLASDTIRRVEDGVDVGTGGIRMRSLYDPPEVRLGSASTAGDIWMLGFTLCEALAHRPVLNRDGSRKAAMLLPPDLSPTFGAIIASCLSISPQNRPSVAELMAWLAGQTVAPAAVVAAAAASTVSVAAVTASASTVPAAALSVQLEQTLVSRPDLTNSGAPSAALASQAAKAAAVSAPARSLRPGTWLYATTGAVAVMALGWIAVHGGLFDRAAVRAAPAPVHVATPIVTPVASPLTTPVQAAPPVALKEVIPELPGKLTQTLHRHVIVGVRVIVEPDGSVFAALEDRTRASGRLRRLALDAAKEWTFAPSDSATRRVKQILFDFREDGATASVRSLD
jgi:hypothetical protein